ACATRARASTPSFARSACAAAARSCAGTAGAAACGALVSGVSGSAHEATRSTSARLAGPFTALLRRLMQRLEVSNIYDTLARNDANVNETCLQRMDRAGSPGRGA